MAAGFPGLLSVFSQENGGPQFAPAAIKITLSCKEEKSPGGGGPKGTGGGSPAGKQFQPEAIRIFVSCSEKKSPGGGGGGGGGGPKKKKDPFPQDEIRIFIFCDEEKPKAASQENPSQDLALPSFPYQNLTAIINCTCKEKEEKEEKEEDESEGPKSPKPKTVVLIPQGTSTDQGGDTLLPGGKSNTKNKGSQNSPPQTSKAEHISEKRKVVLLPGSPSDNLLVPGGPPGDLLPGGGPADSFFDVFLDVPIDPPPGLELPGGPPGDLIGDILPPRGPADSFHGDSFFDVFAGVPNDSPLRGPGEPHDLLIPGGSDYVLRFADPPDTSTFHVDSFFDVFAEVPLDTPPRGPGEPRDLLIPGRRPTELLRLPDLTPQLLVYGLNVQDGTGQARQLSIPDDRPSPFWNDEPDVLIRSSPPDLTPTITSVLDDAPNDNLGAREIKPPTDIPAEIQQIGAPTITSVPGTSPASPSYPAGWSPPDDDLLHATGGSDVNEFSLEGATAWPPDSPLKPATPGGKDWKKDYKEALETMSIFDDQKYINDMIAHGANPHAFFSIDDGGVQRWPVDKSTITDRLRIGFDLSAETDNGVTFGSRLSVSSPGSGRAPAPPKNSDLAFAATFLFQSTDSNTGSGGSGRITADAGTPSSFSYSGGFGRITGFAGPGYASIPGYTFVNIVNTEGANNTITTEFSSDGGTAVASTYRAFASTGLWTLHSASSGDTQRITEDTGNPLRVPIFIGVNSDWFGLGAAAFSAPRTDSNTGSGGSGRITADAGTPSAFSSIPGYTFVNIVNTEGANNTITTEFSEDGGTAVASTYRAFASTGLWTLGSASSGDTQRITEDTGNPPDPIFNPPVPIFIGVNSDWFGLGAAAFSAPRTDSNTGSGQITADSGGPPDSPITVTFLGPDDDAVAPWSSSLAAGATWVLGPESGLTLSPGGPDQETTPERPSVEDLFGVHDQAPTTPQPWTDLGPGGLDDIVNDPLVLEQTGHEGDLILDWRGNSAGSICDQPPFPIPDDGCVMVPPSPGSQRMFALSSHSPVYGFCMDRLLAPPHPGRQFYRRVRWDAGFQADGNPFTAQLLAFKQIEKEIGQMVEAGEFPKIPLDPKELRITLSQFYLWHVADHLTPDIVLEHLHKQVKDAHRKMKEKAIRQMARALYPAVLAIEKKLARQHPEWGRPSRKAP